VSTLGWENNPNGICEDAPCCGCCGPQGDGVIYDEPPDPDDGDDGWGDLRDDWYDEEDDEEA
jgi:hypothetical protein